MEILIILITLLVDVILFFHWKNMIDLNNHISELEKKIDDIQYQIDDVLCNINRLLTKMKDKNDNN